MNPGARELDRVSLTTALRSDGYLKRQAAMVECGRHFEDLPNPVLFRYDGVAGLSREVLQRLGEIQPETIGQAGRIPGMTPGAVAVIAAHVGRASPRE
jgi:tRNA uridine 5-carboxymethylaminomethyl modification enzyme